MQYMQSMKVWVVAAVCCGALAARAAEIDQSTPKATALSFAKATEAGDADAAKKLSVGTDQDQQVLSAMLEFTRSIKQLRESAVKKYADKADEVTGGGMNMAQPQKRPEDSEIKETGDTATVIATKPQPSTMHLKKDRRQVDGEPDRHTERSDRPGPGCHSIPGDAEKLEQRDHRNRRRDRRWQIPRARGCKRSASGENDGSSEGPVANDGATTALRGSEKVLRAGC